MVLSPYERTKSYSKEREKAIAVLCHLHLYSLYRFIPHFWSPKRSREYGMTPRMSRSGNCYDNAYVESFFGTLKTELVHGERYRSRLEARLSIFEYVEVFL